MVEDHETVPLSKSISFIFIYNCLLKVQDLLSKMPLYVKKN